MMQKRWMRVRYGVVMLAVLLFQAACAQVPAKKPVDTLALRATKTPLPSVRTKMSRPYEVFGKTYFPMSLGQAMGYVDEGVASWYGQDFHERPTAIGEPYDMYGLSAAHTTLPLPIMVRVTNLENGRILDLRVNDRGPFVNDRIIDLSYGAAKELGVLKHGTAKVRVETLSLFGDAIVANADEVESYSSQPEKNQESRSYQPKPVKYAPWRDKKRQKDVTLRQSTVKRSRAARDSGLGHYVQVGSFGYYRNAQKIAYRLKKVGKIEIIKSTVGARIMYRVRLGPYGSSDHARKVVQNLRRMDVDEAQIILD